MKYNGNTRFWRAMEQKKLECTDGETGWPLWENSLLVSYQTLQSLSKVLTQEKEHLCSQWNLDIEVLLLVTEDQKQFKYLFSR